MLKRFCGIALIGVFFLPALAAAQEQKAAPTVVLRVRSFDQLVQTVKVVSKMVDKEEVGNQIEQTIKAYSDVNGIGGIDTKRPIGVYGRAGELSDVSAVLMIPVKDQKALLTLMENLNYPAKKRKDGIYLISQELVPFDVGMRFANGYAYVTGLNLDVLNDKTLLKPARVFPKGAKDLLSASVRLDQIPKGIRDMALGKIEEELAKARKEGKPGETAAERKLRQKLIDEAADFVADFLNGATEMAAAVNVDVKKKQVTGSFQLDGKRKSKLQTYFTHLSKTPSLFAGLLQQKADMNGLVHLRLSKRLRTAFEPLIDDTIDKIIKKERNAEKRKQAEMILNALRPTAYAGELDTAVSVQMHEDDTISAVQGIKIKNAKKIESVLREFVKKSPPKDQKFVRFNADSVGGIQIHRVEAQHLYDAEAERILGKNPIYVAFRQDAAFVGVGKNGLSSLKTALVAKARHTPVMQFTVHVAKLARLSDKGRERAVAKKVFTGGDKGTIRVTVEGGDNFTVRFEAALSVLEFGAKVNQPERPAIRFEVPAVRFQVKVGR